MMSRKNLYTANFLFLLFDMNTAVLKGSVENQDFILAGSESKHSKTDHIEISITEINYFLSLCLKK